MGETTSITWTDHTFNPWWGCTKVSEGCKNCYADTFSKRAGLKIWGPDAPRRFFGDKHWNEPLKWDAAAKAAGARRRVFCASMADVFEDRPDLDGARSRLFDLIRATPNLDWLLLTKRPENVLHLGSGRIPKNVWLGFSAENQARLEERAFHVLRLREAGWRGIVFISVEPLLERIDLGVLTGEAEPDASILDLVDWVIVGGESGNQRRPFNEDWARNLRDQCASAKVSFFYKQPGGRFPAKEAPFLDGRTHHEFPITTGGDR